ncbi:hypothetical protein MIR68_009564 [Amoeboaphelidium protococcarum]|nr:hypothetical protein MIR68_009564 [Amoeboaphelidium protococcarum]
MKAVLVIALIGLSVALPGLVDEDDAPVYQSAWGSQILEDQFGHLGIGEERAPEDAPLRRNVVDINGNEYTLSMTPQQSPDYLLRLFAYDDLDTLQELLLQASDRVKSQTVLLACRENRVAFIDYAISEKIVPQQSYHEACLVSARDNMAWDLFSNMCPQVMVSNKQLVENVIFEGVNAGVSTQSIKQQLDGCFGHLMDRFLLNIYLQFATAASASITRRDAMQVITSKITSEASFHALNCDNLVVFMVKGLIMNHFVDEFLRIANHYRSIFNNYHSWAFAAYITNQYDESEAFDLLPKLFRMKSSNWRILSLRMAAVSNKTVLVQQFLSAFEYTRDEVQRIYDGLSGDPEADRKTVEVLRYWLQ